MPRPNPEEEVLPWTELSTNSRYGNTQTTREYSPYYRSYSSVNTPNYRELRKAGLLPDNPYSSYVKTIASNFLKFETSYWGVGSYEGSNDSLSWFRSPVPPLSDPEIGNPNQDAVNRALRKLHGKASGVKFNASQFLAERFRTADLIADTAVRIAAAGFALKRGDLRTFMQSLSLRTHQEKQTVRAWKHVMNTKPSQRVASHWLEFQYGWRPLYQDLHSATELLANSLHKTRIYDGRLQSWARAFVSGSYDDVLNTDTVFSGYRTHCSFERSAVCRFILHYELENEGRQALAQTGISNPLLLAWELVPYSFVIDWFLPVGNYLESLTAFDGFVLKKGVRLLLEKGRSEKVVNVDYLDLAHKISGRTTQRGFHTIDEVRYQRTLLTSFPEYVLKVKSPIGGEPLTRFANALALIRVAFR